MMAPSFMRRLRTTITQAARAGKQVLRLAIALGAFTIRLDSGQTGDVWVIEDSAGNTVAKVDASGGIWTSSGSSSAGIFFLGTDTKLRRLGGRTLLQHDSDSLLRITPNIVRLEPAGNEVLQATSENYSTDPNHTGIEVERGDGTNASAGMKRVSWKAQANLVGTDKVLVIE